MLNLIVEVGIILVALFGLCASMAIVVNKNAKVEKMIYNAVGYVSVVAFFLFALYAFFLL